MTVTADVRSTAGSVRGLDSLRFVAALWVAFSHGAAPPLEQMLGAAGSPLNLAFRALTASFNGTAAVVVFFLISGFCIHLPNVGAERLDWRKFLTRRFVRIAPPLLVIVGLTRWLGDRYVAAVDVVLWSVYCELVYYALYPLLFALLRRWPLERILAVSFLPMAGVLAFAPAVPFLWHFGPFTWLYCAPFWLIGAWLAERYRSGWRLDWGGIWLWRLAAMLLCLLATTALYHLPVKVGYPWTMPLFAAFTFAWLAREIRHAEVRGAWRPLELLGAASYSLYLVHKLPLAALPPPHGFVAWVALVSSIAAATGALYLFVEWPSHQLARRLGRRRPAASAAA